MTKDILPSSFYDDDSTTCVQSVILLCIAMCKAIFYRTIFSVRALKFMMKYLLFSVGHFEIIMWATVQTESIEVSNPEFHSSRSRSNDSVKTVFTHTKQCI